MLVSIDGIDGCGKSTQVGLLAEHLGAELIQEISPSRWGKTLRSLESPTLAQQLAYFTADRAGLAETLEAAAGSRDRHIVSDRSYISAVGYQSYNSFLTPDFLEEMNRALVPEYDLHLILHLPVDVALARVDARGEKKTWCENSELLGWAASVFERLGKEREAVVLIDAQQGIDAVFADVTAAVEIAARSRLGAPVC